MLLPLTISDNLYANPLTAFGGNLIRSATSSVVSYFGLDFKNCL